ncbi:MAG: lipocalin-like domain-containing protein [Deltaproteobacteria bacterium]|nr:lipocalin-like domain-containing protein [Deltaproteobacteria bacterium]MCB9786001.1 lipocalin-like domain-containing protein [Deltaproteobacteria bacterium]
MDATELLGTWELSAWTCTRDGEAHGSPFGGEPSGVLIYSADGHMAAVLGRRGEAATGTATLAAASAEARARAASSTVAYAGSWALEGDRVVHRVRVALHPDQVGAELVREARFDGAELVLETAPERTRRGHVLVNTLRWRRPAGGPPGR